MISRVYIFGVQFFLYYSNRFYYSVSMSVLTFFCFASLLFVSLADPVPPTEYTTPDVQDQIDQLIAAIDQLIQTDLPPILSQMSPDDQAYMTNLATEAVNGYFNYVFLLCNQELSSKSAGAGSDNDLIISLASSSAGSDTYSYIPANPGSGASTTNK